ncbi:hypothetical protein RUA4292_03317 [Ruegeria atlantica]|uniref:Uncharacterized protein n=1 Tax=Ruegeria atlantica TaxID=81569 RepID=A0A0P1EGW8_9RHOB|nr:hypothetical protein RUA4292_03317 [Ruegeria atlantica]
MLEASPRIVWLEAIGAILMVLLGSGKKSRTAKKLSCSPNRTLILAGPTAASSAK